jgi:hypothetical protein
MFEERMADGGKSINYRSKIDKKILIETIN